MQEENNQKLIELMKRLGFAKVEKRGAVYFGADDDSDAIISGEVAQKILKEMERREKIAELRGAREELVSLYSEENKALDFFLRKRIDELDAFIQALEREGR